MSDVETALGGLADAIDWPTAAPADGDGRDLAAAVRSRIEAAPRAVLPARRSWTWRPARRALVAAVLLLLALAVIATAAGFGLPGLRLVFGPAPVSPPPSIVASPAPAVSSTPGASGTPASALPGGSIGLGDAVSLDSVDARAGFTVTWPSDPLVGAPDAAWIDPALGDQVALVWRSDAGLPATLEPGVGLVLTEFHATVDSGFYSKALGNGTTATAVLVNSRPGYWLTGNPHFLFYTGPNGLVHEERRWVGDALIWAVGPITYRLETSLDRDVAIRLAESMP
ncbi:MAG: hypothetical protein ABI553_02995 [Chloroflexota bacterium]